MFLSKNRPYISRQVAYAINFKVRICNREINETTNMMEQWYQQNTLLGYFLTGTCNLFPNRKDLLNVLTCVISWLCFGMHRWQCYCSNKWQCRFETPQIPKPHDLIHLRLSVRTTIKYYAHSENNYTRTWAKKNLSSNVCSQLVHYCTTSDYLYFMTHWYVLMSIVVNNHYFKISLSKVKTMKSCKVYFISLHHLFYTKP